MRLCMAFNPKPAGYFLHPARFLAALGMTSDEWLFDEVYPLSLRRFRLMRKRA